MAVMGNFFLIFLRLPCEFLDLESERVGSICWPNNKIIDVDKFLIQPSRPIYHTDRKSASVYIWLYYTGGLSFFLSDRSTYCCLQPERFMLAEVSRQG